jgi:Raf kinase inhibitor-like YbhB/YbcL family protein
MNVPMCFSGWLRVPAAAALSVASIAGAGAASQVDRLTVTSSAFADGATIPNIYAHAGCVPGAEDRSPPLAWHGAPAGTKSFAVTVFDPDAPTGHGFWHWVMFDIPADTRDLAAGAGAEEASNAPHGARLGQTGFGASEYGGPCPPPGAKPHHYAFTVRALNIATVPKAGAQTTGPELVSAIEGHVLAEGTLTGRFGR